MDDGTNKLRYSGYRMVRLGEGWEDLYQNLTVFTGFLCSLVVPGVRGDGHWVFYEAGNCQRVEIGFPLQGRELPEMGTVFSDAELPRWEHPSFCFLSSISPVFRTLYL